MKIQTPSHLARLVKNARAQRELTQQDVADAVGITRQTLARLERGHAGISFDTVILILDHLGIQLDATPTSPDEASAETLPVSSEAQAAASELARRRTMPATTAPLSIPGSVIVTTRRPTPPTCRPNVGT